MTVDPAANVDSLDCAEPQAEHRSESRGPVGRRSPSPKPRKVRGKQKALSRYTLADLTSLTCRWPSGDPKNEDFQFCGRPPENGKPYCSPHCSAAYVPNKAKPAR